VYRDCFFGNPSECIINPVFDTFILFFIVIVTIAVMLLLQKYLQKDTQEKVKRHDQLVNIAEAEELWSCDEIMLRLNHLKESLIWSVAGGFLPNRNVHKELVDTIFILERIARRRNCIEDTPPETIIGYERE
jgi:hypothetical protein